MTPFELGRVIFEARKMESWGKEWGPIMIGRDPYPEHVGGERSVEHDLAIACAKAALGCSQETTDWWPIESCEAVDVLVLLRDPLAGRCTGYRSIASDSWYLATDDEPDDGAPGPCPINLGGRAVVLNPTHWAPLPASPDGAERVHSPKPNPGEV